ncbi:MAG: NADH-quinone oxidoreductase subunit L, partial [Desulfurella sp.]
MKTLVLLIIIWPLIGFLINGLFGKWTKNYAGVIAASALGLSFLSAVYPIWQVILGNIYDFVYFTWMPLGKFSVPFGLRVDSLSTVMLFVVTFVSWMIHIYSNGYMKGDPGYARYFTYLNLFVFSMLLLILGD